MPRQRVEPGEARRVLEGYSHGTHRVLEPRLAMPAQHVKPGEARWVLTSTCSAAQRCTVRIDSFRFIDPIRSAAAAAAPAHILLTL